MAFSNSFIKFSCSEHLFIALSETTAKKPAPSASTVPSPAAEQPDHPYEQFLADQRKRDLELKAQRAYKRARTAPTIPEMLERTESCPSNVCVSSDQSQQIQLLRHQVDTKSNECQQLRNELAKAVENKNEDLKAQLKAHEDLSKVSMYVSLYLVIIRVKSANSRTATRAVTFPATVNVNRPIVLP